MNRCMPNTLPYALLLAEHDALVSEHRSRRSSASATGRKSAKGPAAPTSAAASGAPPPPSRLGAAGLLEPRPKTSPAPARSATSSSGAFSESPGPAPPPPGSFGPFLQPRRPLTAAGGIDEGNRQSAVTLARAVSATGLVRPSTGGALHVSASNPLLVPQTLKYALASLPDLARTGNRAGLRRQTLLPLRRESGGSSESEEESSGSGAEGSRGGYGGSRGEGGGGGAGGGGGSRGGSRGEGGGGGGSSGGSPGAGRRGAGRRRSSVKTARRRISTLSGHAGGGLPSAQADRVVRVFLASAFGEFGPEKDEIRTVAVPRLEALCRSKGLDLVVVDFSRGSTEGETQHARAVSMALREVSRCDYFVGLLGREYGWCQASAGGGGGGGGGPDTAGPSGAQQAAAGRPPDEVLAAAMEEAAEAYPFVGGLRDRSVLEVVFRHALRLAGTPLPPPAGPGGGMRSPTRRASAAVAAAEAASTTAAAAADTSQPLRCVVYVRGPAPDPKGASVAAAGSGLGAGRASRAERATRAPAPGAPLAERLRPPGGSRIGSPGAAARRARGRRASERGAPDPHTLTVREGPLDGGAGLAPSLRASATAPAAAPGRAPSPDPSSRRSGPAGGTLPATSRRLAEVFLEDLSAAIERDFPANFDGSWLARARSRHEGYARTMRDAYVENRHGVERLDAYVADSNATTPCCVLGPGGCGKTALLSYWAARYRDRRSENRGWLFAHYASLNRESASLRTLLRRLQGELVGAFYDELSTVELETIGSAWVRRFPSYLQAVSKAAAACGVRQVVIVIDGVDALETDDGMGFLLLLREVPATLGLSASIPPTFSWIPKELPHGIKLIFSAQSGGVVENVARERQWVRLPMRTLPKPDRLRLVQEHAQRIGLRLSLREARRVAKAEEEAVPSGASSGAPSARSGGPGGAGGDGRSSSEGEGEGGGGGGRRSDGEGRSGAEGAGGASGPHENPAFLRLALAELRAAGGARGAEARLEHLAQVRTLEEMYSGQVFRRWEREHGEAVGRFFALLLESRVGPTEAEARAVLGLSDAACSLMLGAMEGTVVAAGGSLVLASRTALDAATRRYIDGVVPAPASPGAARTSTPASPSPPLFLRGSAFPSPSFAPLSRSTNPPTGTGRHAGPSSSSAAAAAAGGAGRGEDASGAALRAIAEYHWRAPHSARRAEELPYALERLGRWRELAEYLTEEGTFLERAGEEPGPFAAHCPQALHDIDVGRAWGRLAAAAERAEAAAASAAAAAGAAAAAAERAPPLLEAGRPLESLSLTDALRVMLVRREEAAWAARAGGAWAGEAAAGYEEGASGGGGVVRPASGSAADRAAAFQRSASVRASRRTLSSQSFRAGEAGGGPAPFAAPLRESLFAFALRAGALLDRLGYADSALEMYERALWEAGADLRRPVPATGYTRAQLAAVLWRAGRLCLIRGDAVGAVDYLARACQRPQQPPRRGAAPGSKSFLGPAPSFLLAPAASAASGVGRTSVRHLGASLLASLPPHILALAAHEQPEPGLVAGSGGGEYAWGPLAPHSALALPSLEALDPPRDPEAGVAFEDYAAALTSLGRFDLALDCLEHAHLQNRARPALLAGVFQRLGGLLALVDLRADAAAACERALAIRRELYGPDDLEAASSLQALGRVLRDGVPPLVERAAEEFRRAAQVAAGVCGFESSQHASLLIDLAHCSALRGDAASLAECEAALARAEAAPELGAAERARAAGVRALALDARGAVLDGVPPGPGAPALHLASRRRLPALASAPSAAPPPAEGGGEGEGGAAPAAATPQAPRAPLGRAESLAAAVAMDRSKAVREPPPPPLEDEPRAAHEAALEGYARQLAGLLWTRGGTPADAAGPSGARGPEAVACLRAMAGVHERLGDRMAALERLEFAVQVQQQLKMDETPQGAELLREIAELHRMEGAYVNSLPFLMRAVYVQRLAGAGPAEAVRERIADGSAVHAAIRKH
eukprot:tig00020601_g11712.t1